jgi:hypothetical protein
MYVGFINQPFRIDPRRQEMAKTDTRTGGGKLTIRTGTGGGKVTVKGTPKAGTK